MHNSKLIQVLKVFSKKELKELQEFFACKLHNNSSRQYLTNCQLLNYLVKFAPKYTSKSLTKPTVFQHLYPQEPFDIQKLRYVFSNAYKLIEKFIVYNEIKNNEIQSKLTLLKFYKEKQLTIPQLDIDRQLSKLLHSTDAFSDRENFHQAFIWQHEMTTIQTIRNKKQNKSEKHIKATIYYLEAYYLTYSLHYYCHISNLKKINHQIDYTLPLISQLIGHLENSIYLDIPYIKAHYYVALMLANLTEESYYFNFKALLHQDMPLVSMYQKRNLCMFAQNYCVWKINEGKKEYEVEYLEWYTFQLDHNILQKLPPSVFKNTVNIALRLHKLDWTLHFITTYLSKITLDLQEEVATLNHAYVHFYEQKYAKVIHLLLSEKSTDKTIRVKKFKDIFYQIDARRLLLKAYYELDEERVEEMIGNLTVFLTVNKSIIPLQHLKMNRNFLKTVKKLHQLPLDKRSRQTKLLKLKEWLEKTKEVSDRRWLLPKINIF